MTSVRQAADRLRAVGKAGSKLVIWRDMCRRSFRASSVNVNHIEGYVSLELSVYDGTRDELVDALDSLADQHADVIIWLSGCLRTFGVVEYDELEDTITITAEMT